MMEVTPADSAVEEDDGVKVGVMSLRVFASSELLILAVGGCETSMAVYETEKSSELYEYT